MLLILLACSVFGEVILLVHDQNQLHIADFRGWTCLAVVVLSFERTLVLSKISFFDFCGQTCLP